MARSSGLVRRHRLECAGSTDAVSGEAFSRTREAAMFLKTDAIVIGRRQILNTSLALRLYTRKYGPVSAIAKGAFRRRRKAEPPSAPDLFQRGEVVLWLGPGRERAILHEWSPDDFRTGLRSEYDRFRVAAGCAALVAALSVGSDPVGRTSASSVEPDIQSSGRRGMVASEDRGEHFTALEEALSELDRGGATRKVGTARGPDATLRSGALRSTSGAVRPVLWAFVLRELERAGFMASAGSCAVCGGRFGRERRRKGAGAGSCGEAAGLVPGAGGFVCRDCRARVTEESESGEGEVLIPLPPEAAAAARFLSTSPSGAASKLRPSPRASSALERAVRALAEYHLERAMPALSPAKALRIVAG